MEKTKQGDVTIVRVIGTIDEKINFGQQVGDPGREIHVYCKEVPRINSHGVRHWVEYFGELAARGVKVKFFECSSAIVAQFELVVNFAPLHTIQSICLPYFCPECKGSLLRVMKLEDVRQLNFEMPDLKCPKCSEGTAVFDDIPTDYLSFLNRAD